MGTLRTPAHDRSRRPGANSRRKDAASAADRVASEDRVSDARTVVPLRPTTSRPQSPPEVPTMSEVVRLPVRPFPGRLLTKRQLAAELGRSTRWIELRMREGMPAAPRAGPREHARFDLTAVRAWLDSRSATPRLPLEQRVERLERELSTLVAELKRGAG
jgi:hypothetical protein